MNPKLVTTEIYNDAILKFEQIKIDMEESIKNLTIEEWKPFKEEFTPIEEKPKTLKEWFKNLFR